MLIDLNKIECDDITLGEYIQARVGHILNSVEVLAEQRNIRDTEEYEVIKYQANQILKQLGLE